jgi:hypothetical protein
LDAPIVSESLIAVSVLLVVALLLMPVLLIAGPVLGFMLASGLWQ